MIISRTPYRFSIIGGGSDIPAYYKEYGPSKIISTALTASIYVTYSERQFYSMLNAYDSKIRISYSRTENVDSVDQIQHELIRAVVRKYEKLPESFEITTIGDIPGKGAGLGSSSSLIVGLLKAVIGDIVHNSLWRMAAHIEIVELKKGIGIQDHLAATWGGCRLYKIWESDNGTELSRTVMPPLGVERLFESLIAFRLPVNKSENASRIEKHDNLVGMKEQIKERVPYLKDTVALVDDMDDAFHYADVKMMADILKEAWRLKKLSHGFIDKDIERWYDIGIANGALAGKVSGSMTKGAGHLFFLAYPDDHARIRKALGSELSEFKAEFYPYGSTAWNMGEMK